MVGRFIILATFIWNFYWIILDNQLKLKKHRWILTAMFLCQVANVYKFSVRTDQNSKKFFRYIYSSLDYLFQVVSETWQLGHTYEANTPVKHIQSQALYLIS